ncbi:MAG: rRNA synthase [Acidobacteriota bacterium]|jgi:tRNA pseudouridine32 synthase/23S rRNA pseudouridine746 synthase/23S rRNA pseudouridine1911/1915/1917 synthase|nr:rRNA synthase [Acidobacteriota bacterium]
MSQTLLEALQSLFPDSSKTTLRRMLQDDRVRVNGVPQRDAKRLVETGERVEVGSKASREIDPRITILYEDSDLIAVDKAPGLLTVASPEVRYETAEAFLNTYLGARHGESRVHVVHRLDRDTSGVLVFAKNGDMRDRLQTLFAAHDIERIYVAIVHGKLEEPSGTFHSFLTEDKELRVKSVAGVVQGKEAITHYRTTASGRKFSMLEVTLETGRRNQIRVHLAEAGHPVVGDNMYGKDRENPLGRLALHARHLAFIHPRTRKRLEVTMPIPESFREMQL